MTYNEFLQLHDSDKVVIFETDKGITLTDNFWIKWENNIWMMRLSWDDSQIKHTGYGYGSWGWGDYGSSTDIQLPTSPRDQVFSIKSILGDGLQLLETESETELRENADSFYWTQGDQTLYINTSTGQAPNIRWATLVLGIVQGFASKAGYYGGSIYYDSRIVGLPNISTSRDSQYYGRISWEGGSISLTNTDGKFDNIANEDYYGSECRIYFGSKDVLRDDFEILYTGYLEAYRFEGTNITLNFKDMRKNLSTTIPSVYYDTVTYPNISDDWDGSPIPIAWGSVRKCPAACLNEKATTPSTFNFKLADHAITSISQVYVENIKVSHTNVSLANATFDLSSSVYQPGKKVTVDFVGKNINNPVAVLVDLVTTYTDTVWSTASFNVAEIEATEAIITSTIGLFVWEEKKISDLIEDVCSSANLFFLVQGNGKITIIQRDITKAAVDTFQLDDLIMSPSVEYNSEEYLNSLSVGFDRNWSEEDKDFRLVNINDQKYNLFVKYKSNKHKRFNTLLDNKLDATAYGQENMEQFGGIFPLLTLITKTNKMLVVIGDIVNLEVDGIDLKLEIVSKVIDLGQAQIAWKARMIQPADPAFNWVRITRLQKYREK